MQKIHLEVTIFFTPHPFEGFLGRYLRQRLLEVETRTRQYDGEMVAVVEWVARVHARLNKVIEGHSSSDVSLGPADFLGCPVGGDVAGARAWFVGLWNARLAPLVRDAVREGLQVRFAVCLENLTVNFKLLINNLLAGDTSCNLLQL